jgi:hypothetical protein
MSASLLSIPVNFTPLYTENTKTIYINPNWTIKQMYESIAPIIKQLFNIDEFILIEINSNKINYFPKEAQLHINKNTYKNVINYEKIKNIWTDKLNVSFYVKDLNAIYHELHDKNILFQKNTSCPICFEIDYLCNRYGCSHYICDYCYAKCCKQDCCPICRQSRIQM